ncbi:TPA: murein hydrolase activator EnvC [Escherichia coli]|nr:murein hydrolase activator EnvC [Escherichia coli]
MRGKAINTMTRAVKPRRFAIRPIIYASVLSAGVLLCAFSAHADERDQLKSIQADIAAKERAVRQKQQQRASLLAQLKKQEEAISEATRKLRETQNTLNQLNKQIDEMNASIAKLEQQKAAQERSLAAQLDAAFRQGEHTGIQLILSGEESQRGQRLQAYFGYLNQARQETIAQLKQTREEVAMQRAELEEKQSEQQTLLYEQRAQQAKLTQALSERKKTLAGLESSIQQGQQQLSELRANESRLRNSIARAEAAAKARAEREARKGTTYKPTENEKSLMSRTGGLGAPRGQAFWPVRGPTLHRYGEQLQGELRWKGMVIGASEGTEVKAIADGRVILADWLQGYGLVVVVEHGKGDMSLYGYNQSALVSVGSQVRAGQPIALVGSSGGQGRPSLYFEIRRQGQAVNPQPWLGR